MGEIPDVVLGFTGAHWKNLGLNPVFIFRLLELGWTPEDIDNVFSRVIGPDYAEVNVTTWIDRLEAMGIECSDRLDEPPFKLVLDKIIFVFLTTGKVMTGDFYIKNDDCIRELIDCDIVHWND